MKLRGKVLLATLVAALGILLQTTNELQAQAPGLTIRLPRIDTVNNEIDRDYMASYVYIGLASMDNVDSQLRVRAFWGTLEDYQKNKVGHGTEGTCWVYNTRVLKLLRGSDPGTLQFPANLNESWLEPDGKDGFKDGHWLLVFEDGNLGDNGPIKLNPPDVDRYFSQSEPDKHYLQLTVLAPSWLKRDAPASAAMAPEDRKMRVANVLADRDRRSKDYAERAKKDHGCVVLVAGTTGETLATALPCGLSPLPLPLPNLDPALPM